MFFMNEVYLSFQNTLPAFGLKTGSQADQASLKLTV